MAPDDGAMEASGEHTFVLPAKYSRPKREPPGSQTGQRCGGPGSRSSDSAARPPLGPGQGSGKRSEKFEVGRVKIRTWRLSRPDRQALARAVEEARHDEAQQPLQ